MKYNVPESSLLEKTLWILAMALVAAALILGFQATGGPGYQRMVRHDDARILRLHNIERALIYYYDEHQKQLPASMAVLLADNAEKLNPHITSKDAQDPVTKVVFPYKRLDENRFELCVTYETEKRPSQAAPEESSLSPVYQGSRQYYIEGDRFTEHPKGPKCYTLTVTSKAL